MFVSDQLVHFLLAQFCFADLCWLVVQQVYIQGDKLGIWDSNIHKIQHIFVRSGLPNDLVLMSYLAAEDVTNEWTKNTASSILSTHAFMPFPWRYFHLSGRSLDLSTVQDKFLCIGSGAAMTVRLLEHEKKGNSCWATEHREGTQDSERHLKGKIPQLKPLEQSFTSQQNPSSVYVGVCVCVCVCLLFHKSNRGKGLSGWMLWDEVAGKAG